MIACASGRARTTPCRRASRQTRSSGEASIARPVLALFATSPSRGRTLRVMGNVARKAAIATIVVIAIVAVALALWKLKIVIALVFLGFVLAAAMRPGIERLAKWRIPRPAGVLVHYLGFAAVLALLLWLAVPRAVDQVSQALGGNLPTSRQELNQQAKHSTGIKHQILVAAQKRLT